MTNIQAWSPAIDEGVAAGEDIRTLRRGSRQLLMVTVLAIGAFFAWAANAPLEEVTRGHGKIAPLNRGQVIQSLEGGIIESIAVQEGDEVEAGQVLAVIDDTRFRAAYEDLDGQIIALRAGLTRLQAELSQNDEVAFDEGVTEAGDIAAAERELFVSRRRRLVEATASLNQRIDLAQRELDLIRPLVKRGSASEVKQIDLEQSIADLTGQLTELRNNYFQEVNEQIARKNAEIASLTQQKEQKRDALARTMLRSPVRGIVKNLEVTTRGGVVQPGEKIMEIVPLDDQLYVEAQIRPQDVAFLHTGQPATVKITAYDYTVYGMLTGELVFISADTILDESRRDDEPYYRVRVLSVHSKKS